eukprot:g35726.t1
MPNFYSLGRKSCFLKHCSKIMQCRGIAVQARSSASILSRKAYVRRCCFNHKSVVALDRIPNRRLLSTLKESPEAGKEERATEATTWIDRYAPRAWRPYLKLARADKPIGTWLLLWPCCWSSALAAAPGSLPDLAILAALGTGAFVMRGAGCTINDLWDKDFDKNVTRTLSRPLASGELSVRQAIAFLAGQLSTGLAVLLTFNKASIILATCSLPLVFSYPLMKRFTDWPQLVLGLTFNWGALVGYCAVAGYSYWPVTLPLYASGVCWTVFYDTIYAHQDKVDDAKLGLKSTALYMGDQTKPWLTGFGTASVAALSLSGYMNDMGSVFYALSVGGGGAHLAWQLYGVDLNKPSSCMQRFVSNHHYGAIVFTGIVLDRLWTVAPI